MERDRRATVVRMQAIGRATPSFVHDRQELAAIFAGGFLGTAARAALAQNVTPRADQWPWATSR